MEGERRAVGAMEMIEGKIERARSVERRGMGTW